MLMQNRISRLKLEEEKALKACNPVLPRRPEHHDTLPLRGVGFAVPPPCLLQGQTLHGTQTLAFACQWRHRDNPVPQIVLVTDARARAEALPRGATLWAGGRLW